MNVNVYLIVSSFPILFEGRGENHRKVGAGDQPRAVFFFFFSPSFSCGEDKLLDQLYKDQYRHFSSL